MSKYIRCKRQINEAQLVSNPVLKQMNEPLVKELKGDC